MAEEKAKDQAERLRKAYRGQLPDTEIERVANELDPPESKPKANTPIEFLHPYGGWRYGISAIDYTGYAYILSDEGSFLFSDVKWRPVRFLGSLQVAIDVLPVRYWREDVEMMSINIHWNLKNGGILTDSHVKTITREEARRMEAKNGAEVEDG